MNEIERMLLLPIRLKPALRAPLKDALNAMMAQARLEPDVLGMVRAVSVGYQHWNSLLQGDDGLSEAQRSYVRSVAIVIPELFVLSWDQRSFGDYLLDDAEQQVLEASREDLDAKLSLVSTSSREISAQLDAQTRNDVSRILKRNPRLGGAPDAASPQVVRRH